MHSTWQHCNFENLLLISLILPVTVFILFPLIEVVRTLARSFFKDKN